MICVVSHDAGGAELIANHIPALHEDCLFVLEGPAKSVFERHLGEIKCSNLEASIEKANWVLTGSGWQSSLEWKAIGLAKKLNTKSVTYIDHWMNYRERFFRNGIQHLPDEIWVGDVYAESIARDAFDGPLIRRVKNYYFANLKKYISANIRERISKGQGCNVLYVCEPIGEHARLEYGDRLHWGYTEFEALNFFLANFKHLNLGIKKIVLRPHPSEDKKKYESVVDAFNFPVMLGGDRALVEEIMNSDLIVGCQSMAMIIGLLAGKRVISSIPPYGRPCALPHREIESLSDILQR